MSEQSILSNRSNRSDSSRHSDDDDPLFNPQPPAAAVLISRPKDTSYYVLAILFCLIAVVLIVCSCYYRQIAILESFADRAGLKVECPSWMGYVIFYTSFVIAAFFARFIIYFLDYYHQNILSRFPMRALVGYSQFFYNVFVTVLLEVRYTSQTVIAVAGTLCVLVASLVHLYTAMSLANEPLIAHKIENTILHNYDDYNFFVRFEGDNACDLHTMHSDLWFATNYNIVNADAEHATPDECLFETYDSNIYECGKEQVRFVYHSNNNMEIHITDHDMHWLQLNITAHCLGLCVPHPITIRYTLEVLNNMKRQQPAIAPKRQLIVEATHGQDSAGSRCNCRSIFAIMGVAYYVFLTIFWFIILSTLFAYYIQIFQNAKNKLI